MNRYLVESTHAANDCHYVLEQFAFHGYTMNIDSRCEEGLHTGWTALESENESQTLLSVPPRLRSHAHAIRLSRSTPEKIQAMHE